MTDLTTKTAQSLHAEWCRQMWKKGFHGPDKRCSRLVRLCPDPGLYVTWHCGDSLDPANYNLDEARCDQFNPDLVYWLNLPESRRQEYLATAKAVLPEIVGEVLQPIQSMVNTQHDDEGLWFRAKTAPEAYLQSKLRELHGIIEKLRDRRLEELK
jgi:hypothetical protein